MKALQDKENSFSSIDELIAYFNSEYSVVDNKGSVKVMRHFYDKGDNRYELYTYEKDSIRSKTADMIWNKDYAFNYWFTSEARNVFQGITFQPDKPSRHGGKINLWVKPEVHGIKGKGGSCQPYLDFIKEIICNGNEKHYNYLLDWMADVIQDPTVKKGTAVAIVGKQGTGKGTFCSIFGELLGQHYKHVTDKKFLGGFNGILQDAILINVDEVCFREGEHSKADTLKSYITEPVISIEEKFKNELQLPNYTRFIFTSNHKDALPIDGDDRRMNIFEISNKRKEDHDYFKEIREEMNGGGYLELLELLKERKVTSNLRTNLTTSASFEMKFSRFDSTTKWFFELLHEGSNDQDEEGWKTRIGSERFYDSYCDSVGFKNALSKSELGKVLSVFGSQSKNKRRMNNKGTMKVRIFPNLDECRELFLKEMKLDGDDFDWDEGTVVTNEDFLQQSYVEIQDEDLDDLLMDVEVA
jgi:phage/plasmid-associated DNA primase